MRRRRSVEGGAAGAAAAPGPGGGGEVAPRLARAREGAIALGALFVVGMQNIKL